MTTEQSIPKPEAAYTEAPASWNTSYITPEGFVCRITLRGETGKDLLEKAGTAIAFLMDQGFKPEKSFASNGKGEAQQCSIHQCEMKRYEKDGRTWYSHKLQDGSWCRGRKQ